MGLFDKAKQAAQQAAQQAQQAFAQQAGQQQDGMVHVQGAGGMLNPAMFGGPSTQSVAADDPIWEPINGISLQDWAELARDARAHGVSDEAGMISFASQQRGWNPADAKAAMDGWTQRSAQSMAVGQQFRKFLGY